MWKNWFPFRRKEEKKPDLHARSTDVQKSEKENGTKDSVIISAGGYGDRTGMVQKTSFPPRSKAPDSVQAQVSATLSDRRDRLLMPGSQARSPFTRRVGYVGSNDLRQQDSVPAKPSVMNPAGPLLSTPLLPKIKRALEMNDSFSGQVSSPLTRNRVARSASLSYGPTHPTRSTPGRLPKVCLQRRPSLHLMNSRNIQSPSTVKVAPPDPTLLAGPSFRVSRTLSSPPVKAIVDTQAVVSALRERSCRKRSTATVTEDSIADEEFTQMAKRRRQDSLGPVAPPVSIPSVPEVAPDLARQHERYATLHSNQQTATKRPLLPSRRASFDDDGVTIEGQPTPKRERRHNNSRILSSLSSSASVADSGFNKGPVGTEDQPSGKRPHPHSVGTPHQDSDQPAKKVYPQPSPSSSVIDSTNRLPATPDSDTYEASQVVDKVKDRADSQPSSDQKEPSTGTPKKTILLCVLEQSNRHRASLYPSLTHKAPKPVMMATPADLEQDRKAEDERRVQDTLAFLDDEEDTKTDTTPKLFTPVTQTTPPATSVSASTTITTAASATSNSTTTASSTTTTSASSLSQLLAAPLFPTSQSTTKSSSSSSASLFPLSSLTKSTAPSPPSSLGAVLGSAAGNVAGLVQSSGASVSSGLVSSNPICSTGGAGFFSVSTTNATSQPVTSTVASSTPGLRSLSGATTQPSGNGAVPVSSLPPQYTFKPVFGVQASPNSTSSETASSKPSLGGVSTPAFTAGLLTTPTSQPPSSIANPVPSLSGGFTFGSIASTMTQQASASTATSAGSSFSFGQAASGVTATTTAPSATSAGINFGLSSSASSAGFSFGPASTATTTGTTSAGFSFGTPTQATPSALGQNTAVTFGQNTQQNTTAAAFGQNTQQNAAIPFGQNTQQNTASPFGQNTQQNTAAPFGQNTQQNTAAPFGQNTQLSTSFTASEVGKGFQPKNLFGAPKAGTDSTGSSALSSSGGFNGFGATSPPAQSVFGQNVTTTTASAGFSFGAASSTGTGGFSFGQAAGGFGTSSATTTTTTAPTLGFGNTMSFGHKQTAPAFPFGQTQPSSATASPFSFGQASSTSATTVTSLFGGLASTNTSTTAATAGFSFGAPSIATTAPSGGFNFSAAATSPAATPGVFSFGGAVGPGASAFGQAKSSQPQQPALFGGSSSTGSGFSFGMAQPSAVPAFGAPTQTATPAFGASQPQQPVPSFGGFGSNPPASTGFSFGSATPAKPSQIFGSGTPQAAPAFGGTAAAASPVFGATQPSSGTPVFGASANQNTSAVSSTTPGAGFNFTAGQKSFSFGAPQNPAASPGGGGFQFGQPSAGSSGFDFSASFTGAPQFNFGAGGGAGTGNMFTPCAGSTAPKPRAAANRARRRGAKK